METAEKPKGLTLDEAQEYVKDALHEAKQGELRARCIDGRYPMGERAIAMPGGDAGLLAVGLAAANRLRAEDAEISNEAVRDAVFAVIGGASEFSFHTDEHAFEREDESRFDGCGHSRLLKERAAEYGLDTEQVAFFTKTLAEVNAIGVHPDVLKGSHQERAVMIVEIKDMNEKTWTLDCQAELPEGGIVQAFIYDATLAEKRFEALADALTGSTDVDREKLLATIEACAQNQLVLTAEALANDLPTYRIIVTGETGEYSVAQA